VNLCKVLYDGLKNVEYVPSKLKYAIITQENEVSGNKQDRIIAYADFLENTISIDDLEPGEIVSTEVDLDDPELETLFVALCLSNLAEDTEDEEDDAHEEIELKFNEQLDLGEKEYDEDSLFPFKKKLDANEHVG